jgi:hypothetical protein
MKSACERWKGNWEMATGHNRRLDRLEEMSALDGRTIFIWDDRSSGCVEREKAERIRAGSTRSEDRFISTDWEV